MQAMLEKQERVVDALADLSLFAIDKKLFDQVRDIVTAYSMATDKYTSLYLLGLQTPVRPPVPSQGELHA